MTNGTHAHEAGGCPPQWALSVYVDREGSAVETRAIETHLVGCRDCREVVVMLEAEVSALRAALRVEETELVERATPASAGSLAVGVSTAVTTASICLVAVGWIGQLAIPPLLEWLNPLDPSGAYSMIFDTVFSLRQDAPATFQLVVSAASLFSVAFLLTASFTLTTRRWLRRETAALFLCFGVGAHAFLDSTAAQAVEMSFDRESAVLPAGEVAEETWIVAADDVSIEGTLRGDLIVFGDRVEISGTVDGNLLSGARKLEITGRVTGSVAAFGDRVRIGGEIEKNLYAVSEQTTVTESGKLGGDLFGAGEGILVAGSVGRDAMTFGAWLEVLGRIGRDLSSHAEHAEIGPKASVGGDVLVKYSEAEDDVEIDPRAQIAGTTTVERDASNHVHETSRYASGHYYAFLLVSFAAAFLAGMVLFRAAPWLFHSSIQTGSELFRVLGYGFLTLVAIPIACAVIALSVIGIPLALLLLGIFATSLYFAKIMIGAMIGTSLLGAPEDSDWSGFGLPLLTGLGIVWVASALPWIGGVIGFLVLLAGLGVIARQTQARLRI